MLKKLPTGKQVDMNTAARHWFQRVQPILFELEVLVTRLDQGLKLKVIIRCIAEVGEDAGHRGGQLVCVLNLLMVSLLLFFLKEHFLGRCA